LIVNTECMGQNVVRNVIPELLGPLYLCFDKIFTKLHKSDLFVSPDLDGGLMEMGDLSDRMDVLLRIRLTTILTAVTF
jgi:hypothetical protein